MKTLQVAEWVEDQYPVRREQIPTEKAKKLFAAMRAHVEAQKPWSPPPRRRFETVPSQRPLNLMAAGILQHD